MATQFVNRSSSALYNPSISDPFYAPAASTFLTANTLTVQYGSFALFQNTGTPGISSGIVLGGSATSPTSGALSLRGPGASIPNSFAAFGSVNGVGGTPAAVLGSTILITNGVDLPNSRLNGCIIGTGAGCLTTTTAQPSLNVFDASRLDIFRSVDNFLVPFDPVIGGNNEALFAGVAAIDVPYLGTRLYRSRCAFGMYEASGD